MAKNKIITPTFYIDKTGIPIVRCCASCLYKQQHTQNTRLCMRGMGVVNPHDSPCKVYTPDVFFKNPNEIGNGRVKRKAYLDYFADNYGYYYDQVVKDEGIPDMLKSIQRTREAFEKTTGLSIYLNL